MKMIIDVDKFLCAVEQQLGYFIDEEIEDETYDRILDCIDYVLTTTDMEK